MSETKCCGNCKHFKNEGVDGFGFCVVFKCIHHCTGGGRCDAYQLENNSWTELTPDNVDEIRKNEKNVVVMNQEWDEPSTLCEIPTGTLELYAKWGGCYYYVLPELKIE